MTEWRGWSFASPTWWAQVAEDQGRAQFTNASGAIAVADPDEWDDLPRSAGTYNSFLRTSSISIAGQTANSAKLRFDSSWLPEDTQTATVAVSYNGGSDIEVLRWTSVSGDANFKPGNTNETVIVPLNNPASATTMTVKFGLTSAENDWWWAIDNLVVFTPLTLQVDVATGGMKILGDTSVAINGYEISSPLGSLNAAGWTAGNLDSQNVGSPTLATADFNDSGSVTSADLALGKPRLKRPTPPTPTGTATPTAPTSCAGSDSLARAPTRARPGSLSWPQIRRSSKATCWEARPLRAINRLVWAMTRQKTSETCSSPTPRRPARRR